MSCSDEIVYLRDRVRGAKRQLLALRGEVAAWKLKARAAATREEFLLGELVSISSDLREIIPESHEEAGRVRHRLNTLQRAGPTVPSFWFDSDRGYVLALLQDRAARAKACLISCRQIMTDIHRALFPNMPVLDGLRGLVHLFTDSAVIKSYIHEQLVTGATVGLAFVRLRYPGLDLGGLRVVPFFEDAEINMEYYYDTVEWHARELVSLVEMI